MRPIRLAIGLIEAGCWVLSVVVGMVIVAVIVSGVRGEIPVTASVINPAPIDPAGGSTVDSGSLDVTLHGVPLSVSWPYLAMLLATCLVILAIMVFLSQVARDVRHGRPYLDARTRALLVLAIIWVIVSLASPLIVGRAQPAMAASVGTTIPNYTFDYVMPMADLLGILVGPVLLAVAGAFIGGNRIWHSHRGAQGRGAQGRDAQRGGGQSRDAQSGRAQSGGGQNSAGPPAL